MTSALSAIFVLGVVVGTVTSFDPGCSFLAGQCMYNVKLGHKGQCDAAASPPDDSSTSSSSGCCGELSTKYSQLNDDLDKLKTQVQVMTTTMLNSCKGASELEEELQKAMAARDDIVAVLNRKETELSSSKADLAKVLAKSAKEIEDLRNNVARAQNHYSNCQSALAGVGTETPDKHVDMPTGDYSLVYYNFNHDLNDFTFSRSGHKGQRILQYAHSKGNGPDHEHSWGISEGYYLGIDTKSIADETSYGHEYKTFRAESRTFPPAEDYCIMFWYYMGGSDVGTLTTNIKINGGSGYPVFSHTGRVSRHWELAKIYLDSEYTQFEFKIDFTMSTGAYRKYSSNTGTYLLYNSDGDIAIDDLYVYNTSCSNLPKHPQSESFSHGNVTSYYTFHLTPMTWKDAYDVCRREGPWSALVSVESAAEHNALVNMIRSNNAYSIVGEKGFYTSGSDHDNEHSFAWTNTGERRVIALDNWHAGQPNNVAGNQDCLLMEYPNDNFKWGDVNCDTKHPFICEVEVPDQANNNKKKK